MENKITKLLAASVVSLLSFNVYAVPVLQIGPDVLDTGATYNTVDDTWYLSNDGSSFSFTAYNKGNYGLTAYLVFAATPKLTDTNIDYFDLLVSGDSGNLAQVDSGVGKDLLADDDIPSHSIFGTYYEVFELKFDGASTSIGNTEPGNDNDSATGYYENISVLFNNVNIDVTGIHVDLITVDTENWDDATKITKTAPFSHDVETTITTVVPVPAAAWLFASGLIGLVGVARRK